MIMALLDDALRLASEGLPVFPCNAQKQPVVHGGFKAATTDPAEIRRMFAAPGAALIGVPAGITTRCVVIDVDPRHNGHLWYEEHRDALPPTRTHRTMNGGLHLVFAHPLGDLRISNRSGVFPGVDVRGDGGYIIAPPSPGYAIVDDSPLAELPQWLLNAILRRERDERRPPPDPGIIPDAYVRAAVDAETRAVANASEGSRNDTLNRAAFALGQLVGAHALGRREAESRLLAAALTCGLDHREADATIRSGLDAGEQNPRQISPRKPAERPRPPAARDVADSAPEPIDAPADGEETPHAPAESPLWVDADDFDPQDVPRRPWLVPGYLMRGAVSLLSGAGSAGKSSIVIAWAVHGSLGFPFGRFQPADPTKWLIYNTEDDRDEQRRRITATLTHLNRHPEDLAGRVIRCGPNKVGTLIEVDANAGTIRFTAAWHQLMDLIDAHKPDVVVLDPLVELHTAEENDNTMLRAVVAHFRAMAQAKKIAVLLLHHARKGALAGDMDGARGASSIVGAARIHLTVATMTREEAQELGQPAEHRRLFFRVDGAKQNYAPVQEADWHELRPVEMPSGEMVAAALPWQPPNATLTADMLIIAARALARGFDGVPCSEGTRSPEYYRLAFERDGIPRPLHKAVLDTLKADGAARIVRWYDPDTRKKRDRIWVRGNEFQGWDETAP